MNSTESENQACRVLTEEKLGFLFVRERILTEAQLKTALDFQKAVGKPLVEVIVSLQFVKKAILEGVLEKHGIQGVTSNENGQEPSPPPPVKKPKEEATLPKEVFNATLPPVVDVGLLSSRPEPKAKPPVKAPSEESNSHTAIILDVLLRVLIRKGLIDSDEIKNELQNIDSKK